MHDDLQDCIATAKAARNAVLALFNSKAPMVERAQTVKQANTVAANNQTILMSHAIDLRGRILIAEQSTLALIDAPKGGKRKGDLA